MQILTQQIQKIKCIQHERPVEYICSEDHCTHVQRVFCPRCIKKVDITHLIHLDNLQEFLEQLTESHKLHLDECRLDLQAQFKQVKLQISEQLNMIEIMFHQLVNTIHVTNSLDVIAEKYKNRQLNNNDLTTLGRALGNNIELGDNDEYMLRNDIRLQDCQQYTQALQIIDQQNKIQQSLQWMSLNCNPQQSYQNNHHHMNKQKKQLTQQMNQSGSLLSESTLGPPQSLHNSAILQQKWKHVSHFEAHPQGVLGLAFNKDGNVMASSGNDNSIKIWHNVDDNWILRQQIDEHYEVGCVKFNHDSSILVSGSRNVKLWTQDKQQQWRLICELSGHSDIVWSVAFDQNITILASGSEDRTIRIWSKDQQQYICRQVLEGHLNTIMSIDFSVDLYQLISGSEDRTIRIWMYYNEKWICQQILTDHTDQVLSVTFNHNSTLIASGSFDRTLRIWKQQNKKWECIHVLNGYDEFINIVTFNHDSSSIASGSGNKTIRLWHQLDDNSWECQHTINDLADYVWTLAYNYNSTIIAAGQYHGNIRIYQNSEQQQI